MSDDVKERVLGRREEGDPNGGHTSVKGCLGRILQHPASFVAECYEGRSRKGLSVNQLVFKLL